MPQLFAVDKWCLPLYEYEPSPSGPQPTRFLGSSVVFPGGLLVTCWHCVNIEPMKAGNYRGVAVEVGGHLQAAPLHSLSQGASGIDLATAIVDVQGSPLKLMATIPPNGQDVLSFGYPGTLGTLTHPTNPKQLSFDQQERYLEGYVTRAFTFYPPAGKAVRSWEVDMPTPGGLSGAPLFVRGATNVQYGVMGIMYGRHLAHPDPGSLLPGYVFGLAHFLDALHGLTGTALADSTLLEYMTDVGAVTGLDY